MAIPVPIDKPTAPSRPGGGFDPLSILGGIAGGSIGLPPLSLQSSSSADGRQSNFLNSPFLVGAGTLSSDASAEQGQGVSAGGVLSGDGTTQAIIIGVAIWGIVALLK